MRNLATAVSAYISTRWRDTRRWDRNKIRRRQARKLETFLAEKVRKVDFYAGRTFSKLADLPVIDKSVVMGDFKSFNTAGIDAQTGWKIFESTKTQGRYTIGASTGTSGNRGLFVVSDVERYRWLGVILAKALPGFWCRRERVAVILPLNTPLYDTANRGHVLKVSFFDLTQGPAIWRVGLERYDPTVIIAPPRILRYLAEENARLKPHRIFSAAETLDPADKTIIEAAFNLRLGQIYMATEGLMAVSCSEGMLHLCEDTMHFELEPVTDGLVSPLITDFSRETQIMARYRMNDLLRLATTPCPCGSALQAVSEIIGRADDCFYFECKGGDKIMLTPDIIRNAVIDSHRSIEDYRVVLREKSNVELILPEGTPPNVVGRAVNALEELFKRHGALARVVPVKQKLGLDVARKLRRIENRSMINNA